MKILRKPKLIPISCKRCGCLYQPKLRHLMINKATKIKDEVPCPSCRTVNKANFDLAGANDEQR